MPATKKQIEQGRLKARAENEEETPMRRIRAAQSLLLLSNFTRDPSRIARRTANKFITSGEVSEDVRAAAAKLLELVSSHAVNDSEADGDEEIELPTQYQIKRPKKPKAQMSLEAIREGDDLVGWFWEVLMPGDPAFLEMTKVDFHTAKERARQILLESGKCANRTEHDDVVFQEFKRLVREILMDSASATHAMRQAEPGTPLASRTDFGVPVSLTRDQIVPRPDLSVPPEPMPGEVNARATCSICRAGGFALIHDCLMYQQGNS